MDRLQDTSCNILLISCLNGSLRCTDIGWQGIFSEVTLGFACIWYGGPGKHPIPSKHLDKHVDPVLCL